MLHSSVARSKDPARPLHRRRERHDPVDRSLATVYNLWGITIDLSEIIYSKTIIQGGVGAKI